MMRKMISILLIGLLLVGLAGCNADTAPPGGDIAAADAPELMTDEALVDRVIYLFDREVLPIGWWRFAGTFSLGVSDLNGPLDDTPEGTEFYEVTRFGSLEAIKRATEQVVTREFAETYLYSVYEEYGQFIERDGKLYTNVAIGAGMAPLSPVSATVLSKSADQALMSVVFEDYIGYQETHEVELVRENGIWKLNSYPFFDEYTGS